MEFIKAIDGQYKYQLSLEIMREGETYIVYSHSLDLSAYGNTEAEATKNFHSSLKLFLRETSIKGTLDQVLSELGWSKTESIRRQDQPEWNSRLMFSSRKTDSGLVLAS